MDYTGRQNLHPDRHKKTFGQRLHHAGKVTGRALAHAGRMTGKALYYGVPLAVAGLLAAKGMERRTPDLLQDRSGPEGRHWNYWNGWIQDTPDNRKLHGYGAHQRPADIAYDLANRNWSHDW
jgi:hypothetical protein